MIAVARDDVDGRPGSANDAAEGEPARPAAGTVPPAAVHTIVGADGEQIEVTGVAGDRRDRRSGATGRSNAAADVEPAGPTAGDVPPVAHRAAVGADREHVDMLREARHDIDRRTSPRRQRGQWTDPVPDHLPADAAERHAQIAHLAVVLRSKARRSGSSGRLRTARPFRWAPGWDDCRRSRSSDSTSSGSPWPRRPPSPHFSVARIGVGRDIGLSRLAGRMMVVTGLVPPA